MQKLKWSHVLILLFLGWVGYSWLGGTSGLIRQVQIYQRNKSLKKQLDSLQVEKVDLQIEKEKLLDDDVYLQKVIRSELGMSLPGEKVFRYRTDLHNQNNAGIKE